MRHLLGFTLSELITSLAVAAVLIALTLPSYRTVIRNARVSTAANTLIESIETARSYAVKGNARVSLSTKQNWHDGWHIYYDPNHNGKLDPDEAVLFSVEPLHNTVRVLGNRPVADYISYLGTGESHWASGRDGGAFQAGTISICPVKEGPGYQLVLSRGGRLRKEAYHCRDST